MHPLADQGALLGHRRCAAWPITHSQPNAKRPVVGSLGCVVGEGSVAEEDSACRGPAERCA